jgi:aminoglycoside phosphotransferase (APT) family kinase protein
MTDASIGSLFSSGFPTAACGDVLSVEPLPPGMSGASVRTVTTTRGQFVVRVQSPTIPKEQWAATLRIHRIASDLGVAPLLAHVDDERRVTVSAKIAGMPLGQATAHPSSRAAALGSLVDQLARLESTPLAGLATRPPLDLLAFTSGLWQSQHARAGFPPWALPLRAHIAAAGTALAGDDRLVLAHGDLNPTNLVWDGQRAWLVDWDTAGPAHPFLDWSGFSNFLNLSDAEALAWLARKQGAPLPPADARIFAALRDLTRVAYGCMFLSLAPALTGHGIEDQATTPSLTEVYAGLRTAQYAVGSPKGQVLMGAALLKQCTPPTRA